MLEVIRITDPSAFALEDYEALASQLPRFTLRGSELLSYIMKMSTMGELHALVEAKSLRGLVGFYANDVVTRQAYLSLIVVDASLRGGGYGRRLISIMLESCRRSSMHGASLNVVASNTRAIGFYEKMGFVVAGKGRDDFHLLMTKRVDP